MTQKVALVTGAAAGIGRSISVRLAQEGIAVAVLDLNLADTQKVADDINAAGGKAIGVAADISNRGSVVTAVEEVRKALGPITILVNNAGISIFCPFEELTDEAWDQMLAVNLKGTFIVTQVVLPDMKAAQWGRIINISSSSAQTGAVNLCHYASSKGGVIAMTRSLAQELGPLGITVNNIPPGAVMNTIMSDANRKNFNMSMDALVSATPVRRTGEPEDIANAAAWLASEASSYVTGQTIGVNGGRVVFPRQWSIWRTFGVWGEPEP